jgi:hypothetical protein
MPDDAPVIHTTPAPGEGMSMIAAFFSPTAVAYTRAAEGRIEIDARERGP